MVDDHTETVAFRNRRTAACMNPWVVTAHTKPKQAQPGSSSELERGGGHTDPPAAMMVLTIVSFREKRLFSLGV